MIHLRLHYFYSLFFLILLFCISCTEHPISSQKNLETVSVPKELKLSKAERIAGMFEHEFEKTKDPKLGIVPKERLFRAKEEIDRILLKKEFPFEVEWIERGPTDVGGRTRGFLFDRNDLEGKRVFSAGVAGGLWLNPNIADPDQEWQKISDVFENVAITAMAQSPVEPQIMVFGTGEGYGNADAMRGLGMWRSTDGGMNWSPLFSTRSRSINYVRKLEYDSDGTLFAATDVGFLFSDDNGDSWGTLLRENNIAITDECMDLDIASNGTIYVTMGRRESDGIYRRRPGENRFSLLNVPIARDDLRRIEIESAPSDPNRLYGLFAGSGGACEYILRSDDGGNSWIELPVPAAIGMSNFARNQAWYDLELMIDPTDPDRVFIGGIDIHLSENGGFDWEQQTVWFANDETYAHADQHAMAFDPNNPSRAIFGNDGGVFFCPNIKNPEYFERNNQYNITQYYSVAMHPENDLILIGGTQDNGTHLFNTPGINDEREITGGDGAFAHIDQDQPNVMVTSYIYNSYFLSNDGGESFRRVSFGDREGSFINPTEYDSETNTLYTKFIGGMFVRINDVDELNTDYEEIRVEAFDRAGISALKASPNVTDRMYFGTTGGRVCVVDSASIAQDSAVGRIISPELQSSAYLSNIDIEVGNEDHIIVSFSNYGVESVWETKDGGENWQNIEGNLPDMPIRWVMFAPGNGNSIIAATEMGVWVTSFVDGINTRWFPADPDFSNTRFDMLKQNNNGTVAAASHGRGMFHSTSFVRPAISFVNPFTFYFEENRGIGECTSPFDTILIPVSISAKSESNITAELVLDNLGAEDSIMTVLSKELIFEAESDVVQYAAIVVPKNLKPEKNASLRLEIDVDDDIQKGSYQSHEIYFVSADETSALTNTNKPARGVLQEMNFLENNQFDRRAMVVVNREELQSANIAPGPISGFQFYSVNEDTLDLTIHIANINLPFVPPGYPFRNGTRILDSLNFPVKKGVNYIPIDEEFVWNGSASIFVQICAKNSKNPDGLRLLATLTPNSQLAYVELESGNDVCSERVVNSYSNTKPLLDFQGVRIFADEGYRSFDHNKGAASIVNNQSGRLMLLLDGWNEYEGCVQTEKYTKPDSVSYSLSFGDTCPKEFHIAVEDAKDTLEVNMFFHANDLIALDDPNNPIELLVCTSAFDSGNEDQCSTFDITFDTLNIGDDVWYQQSLMHDFNQSDSVYVTLVQKKEVSTREWSQSFEIFPNPASYTLYISGSISGTPFNIYYSNGALISNGTIYATKKLDISSWETGVYYVEWINGSDRYIEKIIKQ